MFTRCSQCGRVHLKGINLKVLRRALIPVRSSFPFSRLNEKTPRDYALIFFSPFVCKYEIFLFNNLSGRGALFRRFIAGVTWMNECIMLFNYANRRHNDAYATSTWLARKSVSCSVHSRARCTIFLKFIHYKITNEQYILLQWFAFKSFNPLI